MHKSSLYLKKINQTKKFKFCNSTTLSFLNLNERTYFEKIVQGKNINKLIKWNLMDIGMCKLVLSSQKKKKKKKKIRGCIICCYLGVVSSPLRVFFSSFDVIGWPHTFRLRSFFKHSYSHFAHEQLFCIIEALVTVCIICPFVLSFFKFTGTVSKFITLKIRIMTSKNLAK